MNPLSSDSSQTVFTLIYVSLATKMFNESELEFLLDQSRRNNLDRNITGILLLVDNLFLQLLEGEKYFVEEIYDRILEDSRNSGNKILKEGYFGLRIFTNWSMGFRPMNRGTFIDKVGFWDLDAEGLLNREPQAAHIPLLELLKSFYD